jgi:type IV pilus assembly protein PilQ
MREIHPQRILFFGVKRMSQRANRKKQKLAAFAALTLATSLHASSAHAQNAQAPALASGSGSGSGSANAGASAGNAVAGSAANHVRSVDVKESSGVTEIEVAATSAPSYNVRVESGGLRLVVDLANADLVKTQEPLTKQVGVVGGLLTQSFKNGGADVTRLTVSLTKTSAYRVRVEGNTLRITLKAAAETHADARLVLPKDEAAIVQTASVADVRFERSKDEHAKDRVVVELNQVPSYAQSTLPSGRLRLELKKTSLPESLKRALDVTGFRGSLKSVSSFFDAESGSTIVEIDRATDSQGLISVEGTKLVWAFDSKELPKSSAQKPAHRAGSHVTTLAREVQGEDVPRVTTSILDVDKKAAASDGTKVEVSQGGEAGFTSTVQAQAAGGAGKYSGRRIDLDLKDADIHNVLRLLADVGRVNIVTADDVTGSITIRMRNVPWDQALDVVLQAKGLGMVRGGNLIRVAPMAALQKERELKLAAAKQEFELTPLETRLIPVSYASADELQARAKDLLSPRGSVAVDERTNVLITRDIASNLNFIEELVRSLDTQTPQVLIEARVVEATSNYLREVGIQWGGDATFSEATGNPTGAAFPSKASFAGGASDGQTPTAGLSPFARTVANPNFAVNLPAAVGTGQGGALGFALGSIDNNFNIGVRLSAAEASGMVRIVSSPRVLTLDNREARISSGTLIPFSQVSAQGVQTTFQEAKLQLLVKPHVTADGSVSMHVKINRDEPDFNRTSARGDPTILKREAETDLLVMDGHTAVIGGIYKRSTGRNVDQVPLLGDIPILGVLFQRRRATDSREELVIFITPRIVNRAEALGR